MKELNDHFDDSPQKQSQKDLNMSSIDFTLDGSEHMRSNLGAISTFKSVKQRDTKLAGVFKRKKMNKFDQNFVSDDPQDKPSQLRRTGFNYHSVVPTRNNENMR